MTSLEYCFHSRPSSNEFRSLNVLRYVLYNFLMTFQLNRHITRILFAIGPKTIAVKFIIVIDSLQDTQSDASGANFPYASLFAFVRNLYIYFDFAVNTTRISFNFAFFCLLLFHLPPLCRWLGALWHALLTEQILVKSSSA